MNGKFKYHVVLCNMTTQDRLEIGSNSRNAKAHLKEFVYLSGGEKTTEAYCLVYEAKTELALSACYYDDCIGYFYASPERIAAHKAKKSAKAKNQGGNKNG